MAKYAGQKGVVYISTSGSGTATTVLGLNSWSLDFKADRFEVTEFGDANKTYVQGLADVAGNLSGFWNDTDDNLYDASRSTDGVKVYLYPASTAATKYFYGPAWVDYSISVGVGAANAVTATLMANGAWGQL